MCINSQKIKSKINFLNAQIANYHDSGHFSPQEAADLTAPLVPKVQELQQEINELKTASQCHI